MNLQSLAMLFFVAMHVCALVVPFGSDRTDGTSKDIQVRFPNEFLGSPISELPLDEETKTFFSTFPGQIKRFTDGENDIVVRMVLRPTRKLHPSADCFKGSGYAIEPKPLRRDIEGKVWGCQVAKRGTEAYSVCERIYDEHGASYSDVSSWYWAALLGKSTAPWTAITVYKKIRGT